MSCPICGGATAKAFCATVLQNYNAEYQKCGICGFLNCVKPSWLQEAYQNPINLSDVGLVYRNLSLVTVMYPLIRILFDSNNKFVDYGAGYGLFVRMMRDKGLDFWAYDKYCRSMIAEPFIENTPNPEKKYELLTAFEVFEHLLSPLETVEEMLKYSDSILFCTELISIDKVPDNTWWYYGFEHGQHISFFTKESLCALASHFRLNFATNGSSMHLLSRKKVHNLTFSLLSRKKIALPITLFLKGNSLRLTDSEYVRNKTRASA